MDAGEAGMLLSLHYNAGPGPEPGGRGEFPLVDQSHPGMGRARAVLGPGRSLGDVGASRAQGHRAGARDAPSSRSRRR